MVKVRKDLTGQKFGRLTVIRQVEDYVDTKGGHYARWLCQCECGNVIKVVGSKLKRADTKSCGCYNNETRAMRSKKI